MRFRFLAILVAAATAFTLLPGAAPADVEPASRTAARLQQMKVTQHRILMDTAKRREAKAKKRLRAWIEHQRKLRGERLKPVAPGPGEPGSALTRQGLLRKQAATATPANLTALATNHAVSDPTGDLEPGSGQSEVMIASDGNNVMAAWNDGEGFGAAPSYQGVAWSTNAGDTWTDAGSPPVNGTIGRWISDPTIAVNEKTHKFYFCALVEPSATTNGIAVVEGTIGAGGITWGTPKLVLSSTNATALYDKQWIVADSLNGNLYLTYTRFFSGGDEIQFRRSIDGNVNWSSAQVLSSPGDAGYVQGSRPAVAGDGTVYAIWYAIGKTSNSPYGRDFFRLRRSTTSGISFGTEVTVDSMFSNWGMGGAGFNRGNGVTFPSITVDRSNGAQRGRVYVTWNEAYNFYFDDLGATMGPLETENNNTVGTADPFTIGQELRGQLTASDVDWWSFTGTAGQSVVIYSDSAANGHAITADIMCAGGSSSLGFSALGPAQGTPPGGGALLVATLPVTGTYYLLIAQDPNYLTTGRYNLATGTHVPGVGPLADRSRDVRDIFVKWSDGNGLAGTWTAPLRANNTPANFDDWLPEVVVGAGKPYIGWYAFNDYPGGMCAGVGSNFYLTRSDDAGATWAAGSPVSNVTVDWTQVASNIAPNQGDYVALWGDPTAIHAAWADGRTGDPDVYAARVDLGYTAVQLSLASATATPDEVSIAWYAADGASLVATLEKRTASSEWSAIGTLVADGTGRIEARDADVTPGERYGYRLRFVDEGAERVAGETWVDVPTRFELALAGARPNPATGDVWVAFTLPNREPARLELLDVTGRRVAERRLDGLGPGSHTVNLTEGRRLSAGVYVARLLQGGRALTERLSVIR